MPEKTYHFGLVGFPLGHSISPAIHKAALFQLGMVGNYLLFPVDPSKEGDEGLRRILEEMRDHTLDGLNVTIPFKQRVIPFLDELTQNVREVGAVNTIFMRHDRLVGANTDMIGFEQDLAAWNEDLFTKPDLALVLGAGGAARAVAYVLVKEGWKKVFVAARQVSQAVELCSSIGANKKGQRLIPGELNKDFLTQSTSECSIIINTTPAGMFPEIGVTPWPGDLTFGNCKMVYDLVYNPPDTLFLQNAHQAGLSTRNGLGMLVRQATAAFELWTGSACNPEQIINSISLKSVFEKEGG